MLQNAEARILTIPQKIIYFNTFVMPVIEYASKVFPMPQYLTKYVQSVANTYIWRGKTEQLKVSEMHHTYQEGGFNLINTISKCHALFLTTPVRQFLQKKRTCHITFNAISHWNGNEFYTKDKTWTSSSFFKSNIY